jgi:predicted negative regulator of RcsB-dependent stress response
VDRITRKKLKRYDFALEVGQTVEFFTEHRQQSFRYGVAGLIAILLIAGFFIWRTHQRSAREAAMTAALEIRRAPVGPPQGGEQTRTFATEQDKAKAEIAAFGDVAAKYSGSTEGIVAQYYLGAIAASEGNIRGAESAFKATIDSGDANHASLAKLALADVYEGEGKAADAEKLLRSLVDKPTDFVSKEQATIALARCIGPSRPEEARKLLMPLLNIGRMPISRAAASELGSLPR